jgi:hypothetical protein
MKPVRYFPITARNMIMRCTSWCLRRGMCAQHPFNDSDYSKPIASLREWREQRILHAMTYRYIAVVVVACSACGMTEASAIRAAKERLAKYPDSACCGRYDHAAVVAECKAKAAVSCAFLTGGSVVAATSTPCGRSTPAFVTLNVEGPNGKGTCKMQVQYGEGIVDSVCLPDP